VAEVKISELTAFTTPLRTDYLPIVDATASATKRVTVPDLVPGQVATYVVASNDATAAEKASADYVCDGTADEIQINTALAALNSTYGGIVQLTPGLYYIAAPILMDVVGAHLRGAGWRVGSYLIPSASGVNPSSLVIIGSSSDNSKCQISDLTLDASIAGHLSTGFGISVYGGYHILKNVTVQGFGDVGINLLTRSTSYCTLLDNCYVLWSGTAGTTKAGVLVNANVYDTMMSGVLVQGGPTADDERTEYGIFVVGAGTVMRACHAWMCKTAGLGLYNTSDAQVLGGQFENNKAAAGISITSGDNNIISGAQMFLNTSLDISIASTPTSLEITHTHMRSTGTNNIYCTGATRMKVADCDFQGATDSPANITASYSMIHHNHFQGGSTVCMYLGGTYNMVDHNWLTKGITELSSADYNYFDGNKLGSGAITTTGANSSVHAW
jgi:hypothetical protein